jgi:hypothetical protein
MAKLECPYPEYKDSFIVLPDKWLGEHAQRRDEALESAAKKEMGTTLVSFAVAMSLLDDWKLPGLNGNADKWDFTQLDLRIIAWVNRATLDEYSRCFLVPKNLDAPLPDG